MVFAGAIPQTRTPVTSKRHRFARPGFIRAAFNDGVRQATSGDAQRQMPTTEKYPVVKNAPTEKFCGDRFYRPIVGSSGKQLQVARHHI